MTSVLISVENPSWLADLADRYTHAGKRLERVKEFTAKVQTLLDYSVEFPIPVDSCYSSRRNLGRLLADDTESDSSEAKSSEPNFEKSPGVDDSFYIANGIPRVRSIFHLSKAGDKDLAPELLNEELEFAYD